LQYGESIHAPDLRIRFFHIDFHRTNDCAFEPINSALHSFNEIADLFDFDLSRSQFVARIKSDSRPSWSRSGRRALLIDGSFVISPVYDFYPSSTRLDRTFYILYLFLYLIFFDFLAGQQSKLTKKLKNLALNMFLVVNEPGEQKFSLKKSKFLQILGSGLRLHENFFQFLNFFGWPTIKTNEKTLKLISKHFSQNLLKFIIFQGKFLLFGLVHHQKHI
jgi:hypothetical protein